MKYTFITIEGNIGAGKTTLAHLLSKHFNARLVLEQFADNPFLPKFYENPHQYACAATRSATPQQASRACPQPTG